MKDKRKTDYRRYAIIVLCIGGFLVLISPWLFTQNWGLIDFRGTGEIGDTIGGITAPIANLTGAILVYFAFRAQVEANELVQDQIENQRVEEITRRKLYYLGEKVAIVVKDIKDFTFSYTETSTKASETRKQHFEFEGTSAISKLIDILKRLPAHYEGDIFIKIPKLAELYKLLQVIDSLLDNIEENDFRLDDKNFYKDLISYHYSSKRLCCNGTIFLQLLARSEQ